MHLPVLQQSKSPALQTDRSESGPYPTPRSQDLPKIGQRRCLRYPSSPRIQEVKPGMGSPKRAANLEPSNVVSGARGAPE